MSLAICGVGLRTARPARAHPLETRGRRLHVVAVRFSCKAGTLGERHPKKQNQPGSDPSRRLRRPPCMLHCAALSLREARRPGQAIPAPRACAAPTRCHQHDAPAPPDGGGRPQAGGWTPTRRWRPCLRYRRARNRATRSTAICISGTAAGTTGSGWEDTTTMATHPSIRKQEAQHPSAKTFSATATHSMLMAIARDCALSPGRHVHSVGLPKVTEELLATPRVPESCPWRSRGPPQARRSCRKVAQLLSNSCSGSTTFVEI